MISPFPGMDPYLEASNIWPDACLGLICNIRAAPNPHVLPKYIVRIDVHTYVSDEDGWAEPAVEEPYLEIEDRKSNMLVTVIEVLSPANKIRGSEGRKSYMDKRAQFLAADVHLVEIDLLRAGDPPIEPTFRPIDYRIFLSRAGDRTRQRYWSIHLRDRLPVIDIPLKGKDPDVRWIWESCRMWFKRVAHMST